MLDLAKSINRNERSIPQVRRRMDFGTAHYLIRKINTLPDSYVIGSTESFCLEALVWFINKMIAEFGYSYYVCVENEFFYVFSCARD